MILLHLQKFDVFIALSGQGDCLKPRIFKGRILDAVNTHSNVVPAGFGGDPAAFVAMPSSV
jgi:hypothetical protein